MMKKTYKRPHGYLKKIKYGTVEKYAGQFNDWEIILTSKDASWFINPKFNKKIKKE